MELKKLRKQNKLTQKECAEYLEIPLRTYQNYEKDESKCNPLKYGYMVQKLSEYGFVDEEHGKLSVEIIKQKCKEIFETKNIEYCYLFGSYAKGKATEKSDVDLLVSANISGMEFFDFVETLREKLNKRVDVLTKEQLKDNNELVTEILKDGIKIYG